MDNPKITVTLTKSEWNTIAMILGVATGPNGKVTLQAAGEETINSLIQQVDDKRNIQK